MTRAQYIIPYRLQMRSDQQKARSDSELRGEDEHEIALERVVNGSERLRCAETQLFKVSANFYKPNFFVATKRADSTRN